MIRNSSYMNSVDMGDGTSLLFSGISLCMDLVPRDYAERMTGNDFSVLSDREKSHLLDRGHLTTLSRKQEYDAFKKQARFILKQNTELMKKRQSTLGFVLTYNCNLACKYCFQQDLPKQARAPRMRAEMTDEILTRYLPKMFPEAYQADKISFVLYGGEPFLPANRATILRILRYAKERSVDISATTNGLFVPRMIDLFGREYGKIQTVQVTLDGSRSYHDSQRVPSSGKPTFDDIIAALRMLKKTGANVLLRVHTHPQQMDSARELVEYLDREKITGGNVHLYFAALNDFTHCSKEDVSEFRNIFENVSQKTGNPPSSGLNFLKYLVEMQEEKFLPKTHFCGAGTDTVRIVDPLGDIYDCYEDAGNPERRIGAIADGKLRFFPAQQTYSDRHILNIPECLECSLALFCGGGCPAKARAQTGSIFKPYCHQIKEAIAETLKAYVVARKTETKGEIHETQIQ
jgi:uncharacterized protein